MCLSSKMMRICNFCLVIPAILVGTALSQVVPIDNEVMDEPKIECNYDSMSFNFKTRNPYQGHAYVRGHRSNDDCHKDYALNRDNGGYMELKYDKCSMRRARMASPRGLSMSTTVIVSFHRAFITKVDKAYHIQCFYKEEDHVVTASLNVSQIPTTVLTVGPPMPDCKYQVLNNGPEGEEVRFARVGDKIFHKWTCDYPMPDLYCMLVHTCVVDDGDNSLFEVIDRSGCAKDPVILDNLAYITDLVAGTESNVFKFADKPSVFFTCQVKLSLKSESNGICPKPVCGLEHLNRRRFRRSDVVADTPGQNFDLQATPFVVIDLDDQDSYDSYPKPSTAPLTHEPTQNIKLTRFLPGFFKAPTKSSGICLSEVAFGSFVGAITIAFMACMISTILAFLRYRIKK